MYKIKKVVVRVDNYEAIAYSVIAASELKKRGKEITMRSITTEMTYQMDINSESEILKKVAKIK